MFKNHLPLITVLWGLLLLAAGLTVGRLPISPTGGTSASAIRWSNLCTAVHQAFGGRETAFCGEAHAMVELGGGFLLAGAIAIVLGAFLSARKFWKNRTVGAHRVIA